LALTGQVGTPRAGERPSGSRTIQFGDKESVMPRGDKSAYTDKQKRQAEHIEEGYEDRGVSEKEAERRAWATVNATTHGGKKSGSGRGRSEDHSPERKGGHKGGSSQSHAKRSRAAKKGWETRRHG
jgi:plasmid stabilization system protein ParE